MRSEAMIAPATTVLPQGYAFMRVEAEAPITETIQQMQTAESGEIALVTIHLHYKLSEKRRQMRSSASEQAEQGTLYLLHHLRRLVRKTDHVFLLKHSMYFVLRAANLQGAEIVEERLWDALLWHVHAMGEQDLPRPDSMTIGHSASPLPQAHPEELLRAAQATSRHYGERQQRTNQRNDRADDLTLPENQEELPRLAKKLGIPYLTLLPSRPPRRVLQVFSARLAQELRCYPVGRERNMLTVAMLNPQDRQTLERLQQETGLLIFPVLTHPEALESAIKHLG